MAIFKTGEPDENSRLEATTSGKIQSEATTSGGETAGGTSGGEEVPEFPAGFHFPGGEGGDMPTWESMAAKGGVPAPSWEEVAKYSGFVPPGPQRTRRIQVGLVLFEY